MANTVNPGTVVDSAAVRAELIRVLSSRVFQNAGTPARLLRFLVERGPESRAGELKETVVGIEVFGRQPDYNPATDSVVRVQASRLRAKLKEYYGAEGSADPVVLDLPKGGYSIAIAWREPEPSEEPRLPRRRLIVGALIAAACSVLLGAFYMLQARFLSGAAEISSVAVLPFRNLSPDPSDEDYADGVTDEIANAVSNLPGLRVPARSSAFAFRGKQADLHTVGARLRVDAVMEGSVARFGDRLRIVVQVSRTSDGFQIWSRSYDRGRDQLLALRDDMARDIAGALRRGVSKREPAIPASTDPEAHRLYLKARYLSNRRTPEWQQRSIALFEQAQARDPNFAAAHAGLAESLVGLATYQRKPGALMERARQEATRALELNREIADPHATLGWIAHTYDWNWAAAQREFHEALRIDPQSVLAHQRYGRSLLSHRRFDDAERELRVAEALDPVSTIVQIHLAELYCDSRRFEKEHEQLRKALEIDPNYTLTHVLLAFNLRMLGRMAEADAEQRRLLATPDAAHWADIYRRPNVFAKDPMVARAALEKSGRDGVVPWTLAGLWLRLDRERALSLIERTVQDKYLFVVDLAVTPGFEVLRGDPRFEKILRMTGLGDVTF